MEQRSVYRPSEQDARSPVITGSNHLSIGVAAPILAQGDVLGCVVIGTTGEDTPIGEKEYTLAETLAGFLGRHMES